MLNHQLAFMLVLTLRPCTNGIAVDALGMLSTIATGSAIDVYGPISDNAGGIVEMAGMSHRIPKRTDALDAASNTTATIVNGFAMGSVALVSLALFGVFVSCAGISTVDILNPMALIGGIVIVLELDG
jgi:inorganic pyrophosphatase